MAGAEIERLIQLLARLPGLGPRSARRAALHLIKQKDTLLEPLSRAIADATEKVRMCNTCGSVDTQDPCAICNDPRRDPTVLCVVEEVGDLWAIERTATFSGRYHVLGGTLSAIDGVGPDELRIPALVRRASSPDMTEVIMATNITVDGQTTAHYIMDQLRDANVQVSALAHGVPVGGELDYLDDGTLMAAFRERRKI
jgi:recombination protein RecR